MAKPIPKSHGTPFAPRKGAAQSTRGRQSTRARKDTGPGAAGRVPAIAPARRSRASTEPIANALLHRAQQENPSPSGGSMHPTNTAVRTPEPSDVGLLGMTSELPGMTSGPATGAPKRRKRIVSPKKN